MPVKHLFISGRVQGVAFRSHALNTAEMLGVRGWVRNLPDGRVEAVIEGSDNAVEKMLEWCRRGNPPARVDRVEVFEETPEGSYKNFSIKR